MMTIRNPKQLSIEWNERLMEKPDSNLHVIVSKYSSLDDALGAYDRPEGHIDHIERIANQYREIQHWNPEWKLPNLRREYVKTIEDAKKLLGGANPYALSFLEHCHFDEVQQGDKSWLPVHELSKFINSNHGNIWMVWISGCKSWHFGGNLQNQTDKILQMDARHNNDPKKGFEFYDGHNDEERRLRSMETIRNWDCTFCNVYSEKVDLLSWNVRFLINSGVQIEVIQNCIDDLQG